MKFINAFSTVLFSSLVAAAKNRRSCGTVENLEERRELDHDVKQYISNNFVDFAQEIVVPIWFHNCGNTKAQVDAQMKVINDAYKPGNIRFWIHGYEENCKATRKGGYNVCNVYSGTQDNGILGVATLPQSGGTANTVDYVKIGTTTLPGGKAPYDLGDTLTHEIGHWMGLYHTFQGGCTGAGDQVDDTPAEASAAFGCPTGRDSCSSLAGLDPILNFMDYTDDACMNTFSEGQYTRMRAQWALYRRDTAPLPTEPNTSSTATTATAVTTATTTTATTTAVSTAVSTTTRTTTSKTTTEVSSCAHSKCVSGAALPSSCDACVASINAVDSYCQKTYWDSICVGQVKSVCKITC